MPRWSRSRFVAQSIFCKFLVFDAQAAGNCCLGNNYAMCNALSML